MVVIEMNPRVSRSSALASKATGFPIAKIAAKLAVGYTLDEISQRHHAQVTPACFEPSIDYTVVKVPRWAFEKFKGTDTTLTTRMKSVGEAMAIGRTFEEALGKAMRSLENGSRRSGSRRQGRLRRGQVRRAFLARPNEQRLFYVAEAFRRGPRRRRGLRPHHGSTRGSSIGIHAMVEVEGEVAAAGLAGIDAGLMRRAKQHGLSDSQIAHLTGCVEVERAGREARPRREGRRSRPSTPAPGSSRRRRPTTTRRTRRRTRSPPPTGLGSMILGAGPNRIGQGIEFDYCCVHASYALHDAGFETVMVNCNPETVSTDYDTSDRLYFEPLTFEDVMDVVEAERPVGVLVTFGGQTPLKLARSLEEAGVPILGHRPGGDRPGRGPRALRRGPRPAGHRLPGGGLRAKRGGGGGSRLDDRIPAARPAVVRARRARHGDRLRRGVPAAPRRRGGRRESRPPGAARPLPRRRHRGRRRRRLRRQGRLRRRRHGAHRGGGHPLRRLGVLDPAVHALGIARSSGYAPTRVASLSRSGRTGSSTSSSP